MNRRQFIYAAGMTPGIARAFQTETSKPPRQKAESLPTGPVVSAPFSPLRIGTSAQLFVERSIVRDMERVWFTLHPGSKHPRNPLIRADRDWEGWRVRNKGNAIFDEDEKVFKMWYGADVPRSYFDPAHGYSLYARSSDGIEWEKPLVGTIDSPGLGRQHNVVIRGEHACVIKDYQEADPQRRYKAVFSVTPTDGEGAHPKRTFVSADGLSWSPFGAKALVEGVGDVTTAYYDEHRQIWVAIIKTPAIIRGRQRRCFSLMASSDFVHWSNTPHVFVPDHEDDAGSLGRIERVRSMLAVPDDAQSINTQYYGIGAYAAESCTVAFPWILTMNNAGLYGSAEGPIEIQLAASRDLVSWERHFRVPCVPVGRVGQWDSGLFYTQCKAIRHNDEIWLYYSASNFTHDYANHPENHLQREKTNSIGLVKWKLDRFVSADTGGDDGTLTTIPFVYSGTRLELNARVHQGGSIRVEFLDPAGRPIETAGPSSPFTGDDLRGGVSWGGKPEPLDRLRGEPVSLRFHMRRAELYSFAFRDR